MVDHEDSDIVVLFHGSLAIVQCRSTILHVCYSQYIDGIKDCGTLKSY